MVQSSYSRRVRVATWLAFGGAVAAGIAAGLIARLGQPGEHFWIVFPLLVLICALAFAATIPWWRRVDHMQKSGHLESWYWGGTGGAALVLMALVAGTGVRSELTTGAMYLLAGQAAAFLLYWGVWAWRHRGTEA